MNVTISLHDEFKRQFKRLNKKFDNVSNDYISWLISNHEQD